MAELARPPPSGENKDATGQPRLCRCGRRTAELDGTRFAILGLHNCQDSTILHMHASGPNSDAIHGPDELYAWAIIWVRDSAGRWHATRTLGRSGVNGEVALRVEVLSPLCQGTARIELLAAGPSAEVRCGRFTGSDAVPEDRWDSRQCP